MQCITPIKLSEKKIAVPCGRCYSCLRNYQMNWIIRLTEEMEVAKNAWFLTLTYNDKNLPRDKFGNSYVSKDDCQKFIKRLRKNNKNLRYYLASEYGSTTFRPHYHAILFNLEQKNEKLLNKELKRAWSIQSKDKTEINELGFITLDKVNKNRISYVAGYSMEKTKDVNSGKKVFALMSKGIGKSYLNKKKRIDWHKGALTENLYYPLENGKKVSLPRYYRDKIMDSEVTREVVRGINEKERRNHYIENKKEVHEEFKNTVNRVRAQEKRHLKKQKLRKL